MRERLAWLARALKVAGDRRSWPDLSARAQWEALQAALEADYAGVPEISGAGVGLADPAESDASDRDRLGQLAEIYGLDAIEADLLFIAIAPDVDANVGLACDLLGGTSGARPSVALALELCGLPSASAAAFEHLGASGRLLRHGLVEVLGDGSRLRRTVRAPDRLAAHLAGSEEPEPSVSALITTAVPVESEPAETIAAAIAAGARIVWVRAPLGSAGVSTAAAAFDLLGVPFLAVDLRRRAASDPAAQAAAACVREATLAGRGLIVLGAAGGQEPVEAGHDPAAIFAVLDHSPVPVVALGPRGWNAEWLPEVPLSVDALPLAVADRVSLWQRVLPELADDQARAELQGLRLTPEELIAAARQTRLMAAARRRELSAALVREAAQALAAANSPTANRVVRPAANSSATFEDLVLPPHVLGDLRRLVSWATVRDEALARGPVHGKAGKGTGITALFTGGPGTGKTLAAHVVADELGLELFQVDLSAIVDKYIGETEKNLERVFHEAETRNVVLFFDEADALFGSRSEVRDARDRYANQEVSYLLQRMEHFDGITVLATNLRGNLDAAFSRRMQFILHFPDPDEPTRVRLWRQHLLHTGELDEADPVDAQRLANAAEFAGGDIRNIVLGATYDAACTGEPVGMRHVLVAMVREFHKLGRRVPPGLIPG